MDLEDERSVELNCIAAIFPEITLDPENKFSASIDIPINPRNHVKVGFPPTLNGTSVGEQIDAAPGAVNDAEFHNLAYLPPLQLHITLPEGYPASCPPKFKLSTSPAWLSQEYLRGLDESGVQMWEEADHAEIVFGYIDSLQQAAENAFGHNGGKALEVPQQYKIALLDYDIKATKAAFEKETFDCGICLGKLIPNNCESRVNIF
jgi:E3 ubiquitin-protein ligase RNF14